MAEYQPTTPPYITAEAFPDAVLLPGFSLDPAVRADWSQSGFKIGVALFRDGFHYTDVFGATFTTADNKAMSRGTQVMGFQYVSDERHQKALENISEAEAEGTLEPGSTVMAFNRMFEGTFGISHWTGYLPGQTEE